MIEWMINVWLWMKKKPMIVMMTINYREKEMVNENILRKQ